MKEGTPGKYTVLVTKADGTVYRSFGVGTEAEAKKQAAEYRAAGYQVEVVEGNPPQ